MPSHRRSWANVAKRQSRASPTVAVANFVDPQPKSLSTTPAKHTPTVDAFATNAFDQHSTHAAHVDGAKTAEPMVSFRDAPAVDLYSPTPSSEPSPTLTADTMFTSSQSIAYSRSSDSDGSTVHTSSDAGFQSDTLHSLELRDPSIMAVGKVVSMVDPSAVPSDFNHDTQDMIAPHPFFHPFPPAFHPFDASPQFFPFPPPLPPPPFGWVYPMLAPQCPPMAPPLVPLPHRHDLDNVDNIPDNETPTSIEQEADWDYPIAPNVFIESQYMMFPHVDAGGMPQHYYNPRGALVPPPHTIPFFEGEVALEPVMIPQSEHRPPVTLKDPVTGDLKMVFVKGTARTF
ncbi:hypothetical protein DFJ73DRAFT_226494 [Zopfochytrium polystomum]|nr:hypothetical protein DFJ73DRAFT_226494 [Zopfochytrium polystomum]